MRLKGREKKEILIGMFFEKKVNFKKNICKLANIQKLPF
jgi:hypothetical protein